MIECREGYIGNRLFLGVLVDFNKFLPVLLWNLFEEKREIRSIYCRTLTAFIDCIFPD